MMEDGKQKSASEEHDPARLAQLLELELMQKRAAWQQAHTRHRTLRALSFAFLFLVILGALVVFALYFNPGRARELRTDTSRPGITSATPR